jgi:hypothetical protein
MTKEILIRQQQEKSIWTERDSLFKSAYYVQKQKTTSLSFTDD